LPKQWWRFLCPACCEEVLGDLHERFKSPLRYTADALMTVLLVIFSRIRRTADPQILLIQAFALCMSFLGAARLSGGEVLREQSGLVRLAIPAAMTMLGLILVLSSAVRLLLPPVTGQLLGANVPALWLKQAGGSRGSPPGTRLLKGIPAVLALTIIGKWIAERSVPPGAGIVVILVVLVVACQISKRV
jgi:hypothetical protein